MLSSEEKRQLALLAAKIYVENNLPEYKEISKRDGQDIGIKTMQADLAEVYCDAMRFYSKDLTTWKY